MTSERRSLVVPWAPRLILITDSHARGWPLTLATVERVCASSLTGSVAVLLREPELAARALIEQAQVLRSTTRANGQFLLVRDRLDVALWVHADGVHLGEQSVAACEVLAAWNTHAQPTRSVVAPVAPAPMLTRAWHDIEEIPDRDAGALVIAPVCAPRKGRAALGPTGLRRAAQNAKGRPVYALGGIDANAVPWILASGATGVAAIGSVYDNPLNLITALGIARS